MPEKGGGGAFLDSMHGACLPLALQEARCVRAEKPNHLAEFPKSRWAPSLGGPCPPGWHIVLLCTCCLKAGCASRRLGPALPPAGTKPAAAGQGFSPSLSPAACAALCYLRSLCQSAPAQMANFSQWQISVKALLYRCQMKRPDESSGHSHHHVRPRA